VIKQDFKEKQPVRCRPYNGWLYLLVGVLVTAFVALLLYARSHGPKMPPADPIEEMASRGKAAPAAEAPKAKPKPVPKPQPRYQFYEILPESEVEIPAEESRAVAARQKAAENTRYLVQAGSFRKAADADSLKARLALMGLEAKVQAVTNAEGSVWHRVRLGPFSSSREADRIRSKLRASNLDPLLLKVSG